jgi:hypothetical protein
MNAWWLQSGVRHTDRTEKEAIDLWAKHEGLLLETVTPDAPLRDD